MLTELLFRQIFKNFPKALGHALQFVKIKVISIFQRLMSAWIVPHGMKLQYTVCTFLKSCNEHYLFKSNQASEPKQEPNRYYAYFRFK